MAACECVASHLKHEPLTFRKAVRRSDRGCFGENFRKNTKCAWYLDEILKPSGRKWDYLFVVSVKEKRIAVFVEIHKASSDVVRKFSSIEHMFKSIEKCVNDIKVILCPTSRVGCHSIRKFAQRGIKVLRKVELKRIASI